MNMSNQVNFCNLEHLLYGLTKYLIIKIKKQNKNYNEKSRHQNNTLRKQSVLYNNKNFRIKF